MKRRESEYIREVQAKAQIIFKTINELKAMQPQWNALDYANNLGEDGEVPSAAVGAVVFAAGDALYTLLTGPSGQAGNLAKLL